MDIKRKGGLGKGLHAILSADVQNIQPEVIQAVTNIAQIPLPQIETNPFQPRSVFSAESLQELADSIKVHGIIQPITVRRLAENQYQLIAGERRLRAARLAGLAELPAYIRTANDEEMIEMALIENIQRQDLNPIEIALSYKRMIEELGLKQEALGEKVGKNRSTVTNFLRLLKLPPEIQIGLRDNQISMGHAKPLISLENADTQIMLYRAITENDWSVRQTEQKVREQLTPKEKKPAEKPENSSHKILMRNLEHRLEEKFGNKVILAQTPTGKGELKMVFHSTEDLNRLLEILLG